MNDVEARREARRRKILENAEKRLMKITGVEKKRTVAEVDGIITTSLADQNEPNHSRNDNFSKSSLHSSDGNFSNAANNENFVTAFTNTTKSQNVSSPENLHLNKNRHTNLLFLSILWSFLLVFCENIGVDIEAWYINKIFVPLIAFEIVDFYFYASADSAPSFLSSVALLIGLRRTTYSVHIQVFIQNVLKIVQDVMVYFFVFIVCYTLMKICLLRT